jgi:hypothetical protein
VIEDGNDEILGMEHLYWLFWFTDSMGIFWIFGGD